jgi:hypothetical protein
MGSIMQTAHPLYLTDLQLVAHFNNAGTPLPFCRSRMVDDRKNGCLGGVPYRQIAGCFLYTPDEVTRWIAGLPIIQTKPQKVIKTGRPSAGEKAKADRLGITVPQLRARGAA